MFSSSLCANSTELTSPIGQLRGHILVDQTGALTFTVEFDGKTVMERSRIRIEVDGVELASGVTLGEAVYGASTPITDAALERAQGILTPRHIAALRELQGQQAANSFLANPAPGKDATPPATSRGVPP